MENSTLLIDWDSHENLEKVKDTVGLLMKGCSCKCGCRTRQCSCVKAERKCGPGCRCYNCVNVYSTSLSKSVGTAVEVDEMEAEECRIARELCCDVVVDGTESDLSDIEGECDFEALPVDVPDDSDADDVA